MNRLLGLSAALVLICSAQVCNAHFPWLVVEKDGKVSFFFGESIAERNYKLPPTIAKAKVRAITAEGRQGVALAKVETDDFIGMQSKAALESDATVATQVTYGIYNGNRLDYFASSIHGKLPTAKSDSKPKKRSKLAAEVVDTESGVDVYITWKGKPLEDIEVHLYCDDGHEEGNAKTDAEGKVSITDKEVEDGLNGLMFGHTVKGDAGEFDGQAYESTMYYYTMTFVDPEDK
ncbi:MAG: hypothetical protein AAF483_10800 [Planctomycetota bacterium]